MLPTHRTITKQLTFDGAESVYVDSGDRPEDTEISSDDGREILDDVLIGEEFAVVFGGHTFAEESSVLVFNWFFVVSEREYFFISVSLDQNLSVFRTVFDHLHWVF